METVKNKETKSTSMTKVNCIYVYTTPSAQERNTYKIGQTTIEPSSRVKAQDVTSNWERLELLGSWDAAGKTDKYFHKFLELKGYSRPRDDREWFKIPGGLTEIT